MTERDGLSDAFSPAVGDAHSNSRRQSGQDVGFEAEVSGGFDSAFNGKFTPGS
jgi:hypothetical protein